MKKLRWHKTKGNSELGVVAIVNYYGESLVRWL